MRKHLLIAASLAVLLFGAACGGDDAAEGPGSSAGFSADENKAAKALGEDLTKGREDPSEAQEEAATCTANEIVGELGTDKLVDAGLMNEDFEVQESAGDKVPQDIADGVAAAIVACQNIEAEAEADREIFPDASDEDFDTYVACLKDIDGDTLETAISDSMVGKEDSAALKDYTAAAEECRTPLGEPQLGGQ
jgi:hypothetical protein